MFLPQLKPTDLPVCEEYYKQQGYDIKYQNGRLVLTRRSKRQARRRRQGQVLAMAQYLTYTVLM